MAPNLLTLHQLRIRASQLLDSARRLLAVIVGEERSVRRVRGMWTTADRKQIRCSGFENSEGRCTNCQRFNQECVFTPVHSGQTQAFVPLQAANRGRGGYPPNQPVYGAFGQPLAYHYAVQAHPGFAPAPPGQPGAPPPGME